jgi:hypothetical protein
MVPEIHLQGDQFFRTRDIVNGDDRSDTDVELVQQIF